MAAVAAFVVVWKLSSWTVRAGKREKQEVNKETDSGTIKQWNLPATMASASANLAHVALVSSSAV
jgi:hypothetical protein